MRYAALALLFLIAGPAFAASITASGLLAVVVYLVIVGLIWWAVWWFLDYVAAPEPVNKILRVLVALAALLIVVNLLLGLVGAPLFSLR